MTVTATNGHQQGTYAPEVNAAKLQAHIVLPMSIIWFSTRCHENEKITFNNTFNF